MLQTSEKSQNVIKQLVFLLIWWASFNGIMIIFSQYEKKNPGFTSIVSPANLGWQLKEKFASMIPISFMLPLFVLFSKDRVS